MSSLETAGTTELAALFDAHFDYVWRSLLRLGVSPSDAEDVTQDVFLVVHRRLHTYDRTRPIRPWLFGIAHRAASDWRRLARHGGKSLELEPEIGRSDPEFARLEDAELVHRALASLDPDRRAILILHELDGVAIDDASRELEIPVNTAYSRLRRGREDFSRAVRALLEARRD
jgi:RNA polymerase sigma-70 factor (ECF subfamily)